VTLTTHPHLRGRESVGAIRPLHPSASMVCSGTALLLNDITGILLKLQNNMINETIAHNIHCRLSVLNYSKTVFQLHSESSGKMAVNGWN
jgi:hypothetical protein